MEVGLYELTVMCSQVTISVLLLPFIKGGVHDAEKISFNGDVDGFWLAVIMSNGRPMPLVLI